MLIAQISDTHIKTPGRRAYGVVDTSRALSACIAHLARQDRQPDLVLFTGDIADFGEAAEYVHFKELLGSLACPVFLLPGNHDNRDAMRAAWPDAPWSRDGGPLHSLIDDWPVRVICLDTVVPGSGGGHLSGDDLAWLDARLSEKSGQPTVVAMHHPPFTCGVAHMDAIALDNPDEFAAVVARHPHIVRILCGHLHRPIHAMVGGRSVVSAPSPAHQVALDLDPLAPSRFLMEPPGYLLHLWRPPAGLVTHTAVIGDFGPRHPFFKDGALID